MKILAFTSIRSDYDLLSPLYKLLSEDKNINFKTLVSGAHLSVNYGLTQQYIKKDGFEILLSIETLINSNTMKSKLKTASLLLQNSIDVVDNYNPDLILYAGDREDVIMAGLIGTYLRIPTIHFYGGDHEMAGHEDTVIRHATSKLSTFHFVSNDTHEKRLLSIGENKNRIFNIGSISLDRFRKFKSLKKKNILEFFKLNPTVKKFALVIYHPSPSKIENDSITFKNILSSLKENNIFSFVSYPNTDSNNNQIIDIIKSFSDNNSFYFFKNLDREIFLSIFKKSEFIIGNSSAGIYEAASVPIPAINVGSRQKNRMSGKNIVFCDTSKDNISNTIKNVTTKEFKDSIKNIKNIYGDGKSAKRAYKLIKNLPLKKLIHKTEDPLCM